MIATAADLEPDGARPPIGRPISGTTAYVLGPWGEVVPPGSPGELCLGGSGLARGYVDGSALADGGLYRTGDRVRAASRRAVRVPRPLRRPGQARGFRIEPAEIEAAIDRPCMVTVRDERLVAYVAGPVDGLRERVAVRLPAHLVPDAWVSLDALPLTINGKVDQAALPDPAPVVAAEFVEPRNDAETLVASVWADVLGLAGIGAFDDFFALGGHSLLAMRVTSRLREALDLDVPIRTFFERPTVAGLALAVEELLDLEMA